MWKNQGSWNFFHTKLIPNSSNKIWLEVFIPRLPVRTSPPWEGLGEAPWGCSSPSSFYCSRRDAADGMPVMALVLIFVSPHSPLGVRVFYASCFAALFPCLSSKDMSSREICHQRKYVIKRYVIKENMSLKKIFLSVILSCS